jgi:uncharacterized OB-fold protein
MNARIVEGTNPRMVPELTDANRPFWNGGERGELVLPRCERCDRWLDPGSERCDRCERTPVQAMTSGRGTVFAHTVNAQAWNPDLPVPYVVALVELDEQADLRLPTNIVGCEPDEVRTGMAVRVLFEHQGEAWVPLFEPA